MKKMAAAACTLFVMLLCLSASSSALLTDTKEKENTFSFGNNEIGITEVFDKPSHYVANTSYKKQVSIKNTGTIPCYVRVFAEASNSEIPVSINYNTTDWKKNGDWWYYGRVLEPNETTSALISSVKVGNISDDEKENFQVIVYSESVQSDSYSDAVSAFEGVDG